MTPLEAQMMEMNTPAPDGVLPVRLAKVESRPFGASVTYTGQAVGFVEQAVVPRVTGTIVSMPYYVGTRVTKGQLLARLDTTQLDPIVGEKAAGVATAQEGVGVSAMEYEQALSAVTQARAEVTIAEGESAEARAMLDAAQQGRFAAESRVSSAEAEVEAMGADVASAEAERTLQNQDLQRMRSLFEEGAVPRATLQRAEAGAAKAEAEAGKSRERVRQARAGVTSARADLRRVDAEIAAARRKVQQADAQIRAKQASIRTAQAAAKAAKGRIGQSHAEVSQAAAGLRGATAQLGYAELRAEVDGVITERVISPGVVVSPGQTILKIAQVSPIRLQANVPEAELAKIKPGTRVEVSSGGSPVVLQVSSVSPAVDTTSRTGVVEALYANKDRRFSPGQYVTMRIFSGNEGSALVVPSDAVQTNEQGAFVWVAEPAMNGEYAVSRTPVELAGRSGDAVAVRDGLNQGQMVVASPPYDLASGARVAATEVSGESDGDQTIEITDAGYSPPTIKVPGNKPFKVTFIRRAAETCGDEVIFPDLNIRRKLPLNEPVTIDLPAMPPGKALNFACPMNMLKGKAVSE
jgi:RND family efflux transporter MFP subunit